MSELPGQKSSGKEHFWGKIHLGVRFEFISTVIEIMSHSRFISSLVCKVVHKLHVNGGGGSSSMNHSNAMDQHECFDRRQNGIQDLYKTKLQEMPQITIDSSICIISSRTRRRQTCKQKRATPKWVVNRNVNLVWCQFGPKEETMNPPILNGRPKFILSALYHKQGKCNRLFLKREQWRKKVFRSTMNHTS